MSSSNTKQEDPEHTPSAQAPTFTFGGYISPNPKPIPLGVRLRPDPLIEYQTKNVVQYETKTEHSPESQQLKLGDEDQTHTESISPRKDSAMQQQQSRQVRTTGTPAKVKVLRQAKQIESLQAQLDQMRIENEKLRSRSNSQSSSMSITPREELSKPKHIMFDQSVKVVDCLSSPKREQISDRASVVRAKRNHTPHKASAMSKEKEYYKKVVHATLMTQPQVAPAVSGVGGGGGRRVKVNQKHNGDKQSRGAYRITPIPTKPRRKRIAFKSKLKSIAQDKENVDAKQMKAQMQAQQRAQELAALADTAATPQNRQALDQFVTPNQSFNQEVGKAKCAPNQSFNLGKGIADTPSEASSFLDQGKIEPEETPEFMHQSAGRGGGNGASNVATPILTPVKDAKVAKPFTFAWNKK